MCSKRLWWKRTAPCSIGDPVVKSAIKAALSTGALSSGLVGYNLIAPLIEKIMSVDTACRDSSLQSYSTSRGKICATSQVEADALTSGAKWSSLKICEQMSADQPTKAECQACASKSGVWTAIGCIETSQEGIVSSLIKLGLVVGGGVVLLMILGASFKLSTSKGDPKQLMKQKK